MFSTERAHSPDSPRVDTRMKHDQAPRSVDVDARKVLPSARQGRDGHLERAAGIRVEYALRLRTVVVSATMAFVSLVTATSVLISPQAINVLFAAVSLAVFLTSLSAWLWGAAQLKRSRATYINAEIVNPNKQELFILILGNPALVVAVAIPAVIVAIFLMMDVPQLQDPVFGPKHISDKLDISLVQDASFSEPADAEVAADGGVLVEAAEPPLPLSDRLPQEDVHRDCGARARGACYSAAVRAEREGDPVAASRLYRGACFLGSIGACASLVALMEVGAAADDIDVELAALHARVCLRTPTDAPNRLRAYSCYVLGRDMQFDARERERTLLRAQALGFPAASAALGQLYMDRSGGVLDYAQARQALSVACEGGRFESCADLGYLHSTARGGARDLAESRRLYELACANGVGIACFHLGFMAQHGRGGERDTEVATRAYARACELGHTPACEAE